MPPELLVALLTTLVLVVVAGSLQGIRRRVDRLLRLESKIDALLAASGVSFDPLKKIGPDVRNALASGDKIGAIKAYRDATGVGLKEAKDAVEEFARHMPASGF